jgi:ribosomal protein S18 acetylase RimI-like enzyme
MHRPASPEDTPALVRMADETGFFRPIEIEALQEVLDDWHAANRADGHRCDVWLEGGEPIGFVYFAPAPMTDRTWQLWWIVVRTDQQGRGLGSAMLRHAEAEIREANGRVLFIETGSIEKYEPTRRFYLKHGYDLNAELKDFYMEGDSMIVFRKAMT